MNPLSHLIFGLSLPLGVLALLIFPFLFLVGRGQTSARHRLRGASVAGLVLWLLGIVVTLAGAQHARAPGGHPTLLAGNALVCLGGLVTLYAALRVWRSRKAGG